MSPPRELTLSPTDSEPRPGANGLPAVVRDRLRSTRRTQGQTLRDVASAIGVAHSLVHQIEEGRCQPSIPTLSALAAHLGISLDGSIAQDELQTTDDIRIVRAESAPTIDLDGGQQWSLLAGASPRPGSQARMLLVTLAPGADSAIEGRLRADPADRFVYVIEGSVNLLTAGPDRCLRAGDSTLIASMVPARLLNAHDGIARLVCFELRPDS